MWKSVVGLFLLINLTFVTANRGVRPRPRCPRNETLDPCFNPCPPRYCGVNIAAISCAPVDEKECRARCRCKDGYLRNKEGKCILEKDCPTCTAPNTVYDVCIRNCPPRTCEIDDRLVLILCEPQPEPGDKECVDGCRCADGYVTNAQGDCVTREECPPQCPENEELAECPSAVCRPKVCEDVGYPVACPDIIGPCREKPACICKEGYVRNCLGVCIPMKDCPACGGDENAVSDECGNFCGTRCSDLNTNQTTPCDSTTKPPCSCQYNSCICKPGYYYNEEKGQCVTSNECTNPCPKNETLVSCYSDCPPEYCGENIAAISCPAIDPKDCKPGCMCKDGYRRDVNGNCIREEDCPKCPPNERYYVCDTPCPLRDCSVDPRLIRCAEPPQPGDPDCVTGCNCIDGYAKDSSGKCVPRDQCPKCTGPHEVYNKCIPHCPPQGTCENIDYVYDCPQETTEYCYDGCVCEPGYYRNYIGECVTEEQCRKCGENSYFSCGGACDNVCRTMSKQNQTHCPIYTFVCVEMCYCYPGYAEDDSGKCIPIEQCPPECGQNEEYVQCPSSVCRPRTCSEVGQPVTCTTYDPNCKEDSACICEEGYARNASGVCIPIENCTTACGPNEVMDNCSNARCVRRRCFEYPAFCAEIDPSECTEGCVCKPDYYLLNETCVPESQCIPPKCPENEEWSTCANGGCDMRKCSELGGPTLCRDPMTCIGDCVCKKDYLRDVNGKCVPISQCPTPTCPGNETYSDCSNGGCGPFYCTDINNPYCILVDECRPGCICKQGYVRDGYGNCIKIEDCAPQCGANETYSNCSNGGCGPWYCTDVNYPTGCVKMPPENCKPGCICSKGYVKNEYDDCIAISDCPESRCKKEHEHYESCAKPCPPEPTCDTIGRVYKCPYTEECLQECRCDDGYYRNRRGQCVTEAECISTSICGENERFEQCPPALCTPQKCSDLGYPIPCPLSTLPPDPSDCPEPPGCVCVDNYVRDDSGACIPKEQCPSCGGDPNAVSGCGVNCGKLCSNYNQTNVPCIKICKVNACDCREGYVLDENTNVCVRPEECTPPCGENEKFEQCPDSVCEPQTCSEVGFPRPCPLTVEGCSGPGACICDYDYVRDDNGRCIPKRECPSCGGDPNAISGCGVNCGRLCSNYDKGPVLCPRICYPEACDCRDGFVLDENAGKCVVPEECTPVCEENEVYSSCTNGGCGPKNCYELGGPIRCVRIDPRYCKQGCICAEGYLRNNNGICVPEDQCNKCNGPNEYYDSCAPTCPPQTCESIGKQYNCPIMPAVCRGACRCEKGYYRNKIGECISETECLQCTGPNEYFSCGGACDNVCATLQEQNQTHCPIINIQCNRMCYCEEGYARDSNNICIPIDQCPAPTCGENERFEQCPPALCVPQKCSELGFPISCPASDLPPDPSSCPELAGCMCIDNYVRDDFGACIPKEECPSCGGDPNAVSGCGVNCGRLCSNYNQTDVACIEICKLNGCDCRDGFVLDENTNTCVRPEECTPTCGTNEIYDVCANAPCGKRSCSQLGEPDFCIDVTECIGECVCQNGYLRDDNGICIPQTECPALECGQNEVFERCPSSCVPQRCADLGYPIPCPDLSDPANCLQPNCVCKENYVRDDSGNCIPKRRCPSCGGDPNAVSGCGVNCGRLCSNYNETDVACIQICYENACDCRNGFVFDENARKCIRPEECPPPCAENERFEQCPDSVCQPQSCTEVGYPKPCPLTVEGCSGPGACICDYDYVRDDNGRCIPKRDCPSCGGDQNAISGCGVNCGRLCSNYDKGPIPCPRICYPEACDCRDGFVLDENTGKCVVPEECTPICQANEVYSSCTNGGCGPKNCYELGGPIRCVKIDPRYCREGCICAEGYLRDSSGVCVPEDQCNAQCNGPNEYFSCGGACDNVCATLQEQNQTNCPIKNIKCNPMCYCEEGYARDSYNICIPIEDCPAPLCGENERFEKCPPLLCTPQKCSDLGFTIECPDLIDGDGCPEPPGCVCNDNYVRDDSGKCIPVENCPSCGGDPNAVSGCGVNCGRLCSNYNLTDVACIAICYSNACDCREGYVYDEIIGMCVRPNDCTPACGENEVYDRCANGGCKKRDCSQLGQPDICIDVVDCNGGCVCQDGYLRESNGTCVPENECKEPVCGLNERYEKCPRLSCEPTSCSELGFSIDCPLYNSAVSSDACSGPPACVCDYNSVRDDNGICIPKNECPSCGGDPNAVSGCGGNCGRLCSNYKKKNVVCPLICNLNGCDCKKGYVYDSNQKKCVRPKDCSNTLYVCGENEVYSSCVNDACEIRNCSQVGEPQNCMRDIVCYEGCICIDGYLRTDDGVCVPQDQCPLVCTNLHEVYDPCPYSCPPQTCRSIGIAYPCAPPPTDENGNLICRGACRCKSGYYRNSNGECISEEDCSKCNGPNEYYSSCGGPCDNICATIEFQSQTNCPIKNKRCYAQCYCDAGYARDENNICVPIDLCEASCNGDPNAVPGCGVRNCEMNCANPNRGPVGCPDVCQLFACDCKDGYLYDNNTQQCVVPSSCTPSCGPDEVYSDCITGGCQRKKCSDLQRPEICINPIECTKGCICRDGYLRADDGTCVPVDQCPKPTCGQNEVYSGCANSGCRRRTCAEPGILCIDPIECVGDCICLEGYVRDDNGNCIPEDECPPKCDGPNEYYAQCGGPCDNVCATIDTQNQTYCPISIERCFSQCYCNDGYARDDNNICIPIDQCGVSCNGDPNAVSGCGSNCGRRCSNYGERPVTYCTAVCRVDGCDCKQGYVYDDNIQQCVLPEDCTPVCGKYEVYDTCANGGCSRRRCSDSGIICRRPKKCIGDCVCIEGYSRNEIGICIPESQCDGTCPENEVYNSCANSRCGRTNCSELRNAIICSDATECVGDCICADGYLRNENGVCVPENQCFPQCGPNEIFDNCPYTCPPRTCESLERAYICPIETGQEEPCNPSCVCKYGYYRNKIGECISEEECLQCMGPNEYFSCSVACDNVCATLSEQSQTNCPIINKDCNRMCYCEYGYARNSSNICIPISDCPDPRCGDNERYLEDPSSICEPKTCKEVGFELNCTSADKPKDPPGCYCKQGFVRSRCGSCIRAENCPSCGGDPNARAGCGVNCGRTCSTYGKDVSCITICYENACDCIDGYVLDEVIGKCVRFEDCTTTDLQPSVNVTEARLRLELGEIKLSLEFLYQLISSEPDENAVSSATSVLIPLAQLALFCEDQVLEELLAVLNLRSKEEIKAVFPALIDDYENQENVEFEVATKYYADNDYPLSNEFIEKSEKYFDAEGENVDFSENVNASDTINTWVEEKTRGKITDLVNPDMFNQDTRFVLVNAIYFLGDWINQFNPNNTETKDFTKSNGETVPLEIMYQQKSFRYSENNQYQVVELPYLGNNFTFLIVLPRKADGLLETVENLKDPVVFQNTVNNLRTERVQVYLPKMDIEKKMDIAEMLQKANVTAVFDPRNNGIKGVLKTYEAVFISAATQVAKILIDETGTQAAAATAVVVQTRALPIPRQVYVFEATRPFAFCLLFNKIPIFCGAFVGAK